MKVESWYDDEDKIGTDIKPDEVITNNYYLYKLKKTVLNLSRSI